MLPSPPALVPDLLPVALPGAVGGTICRRAPSRRAAAGAGLATAATAAGLAAGAFTLDAGAGFGPAGLAAAGELAVLAASAASGWRTARRACRHWRACWRTTWAASSALIFATSSLDGTRSTVPLRRRLTSSPRKASGLACSSASMVCSRLKLRRRSSPLAIFDSDSPGLIGPYCMGSAAGPASAIGAIATGAGRAGCGAGTAMEAAGASAGARTGTGAAGDGGLAAVTGARACGTTGAAGSGRCTNAGAGVCGMLTSGGNAAPAVLGASISAEYSRTSRPAPQSTSIRKLSTGCSTGRIVVTRMTGLPLASLPRLNCRSAATPLGGARPTRRKVSGEASRACSAANSPGVVETMGISASSGWLRLLLTWI